MDVWKWAQAGAQKALTDLVRERKMESRRYRVSPVTGRDRYFKAVS